jgi:3-hydroxybutyrate dehydrogenase
MLFEDGAGMSLKGKRAIVTGSTSGIGLAIATAFAAAGCDVMMNGFGDPAEIERRRAELSEKHKIRARYHSADMTKPAEIRDLAAMAAQEFGGVDILVNNAGIQHVARIVDFPENKWDAVIAINLSAAFHGAKAVLPHMTRNKWGRIINIASAHGLVASGEKAAYVTAKHGLVGLTKVLAIETANDGITCNAICPGWVLTPLVEQQIAARAKAEGIPVEQASADLLSEKQPMLQFTTPEKIAALAVFLCGDGASTMTGTALPIDGGWVAQ